MKVLSHGTVLIKNKFRTFGVLGAGVFIYFACRLLTLLTAVENVSWPEELGVGTITRELILGLKKPFTAYQIDVYAGESLVSALLAVPFFKIMGANLIALKSVTLLCSVLTVLISALFLNRHFGLKSALWALFFFTFSPPAFTAHSLIPMNGHTETLLGSVLMLVCFYEFLFSEKKKLFFLILSGFFAGFSFWFFYEAGIAVAACLAVWYWNDPKSFFSKKIFTAGFFFLLGFIPWFITAQTQSTPFDGGRYLYGSFWGLPAWNIWWIHDRLIQQILFSLPRSFSFLSPVHVLRDIFAYGYCLFFLAAAGPFWFKRLLTNLSREFQDPKQSFFVIYPVLFAYAYAVTGFVIPQEYPLGTIAFRYYTPLYFFAVFLAAIALARGKISRWFLFPLLLFSLAAQHNMFFKEPPGRGFNYKGYTYLEQGVRWDVTFPKDSSLQISRLASRFSEPDARFFFGGLIQSSAGRFEGFHPPENYFSRAFLENFPAPWRTIAVEAGASVLTSADSGPIYERLRIAAQLPDYLRGYFFKGLFSDFAGQSVPEILNDRRVLDSLKPEDQAWFYWALGSASAYETGQGQDLDASIMGKVRTFENHQQAWFYRGLGSGSFGTDQPTFFISTDFMNAAERLKKEVPPAYLNDYYWGIGWVIRLFFLEDKIRAQDWLSRVEEPFREHAANGFNSCAGWYGLE